MAKMKDLKAAIDKKVDELEREMLALEAQLMQTKEQALKGLEQRERYLREALDQVQGEVRSKLEHLRVQAALGKADARDTVEGQREKFVKTLSDFESRANQKLKAAAFESGQVWDDLVERAKTLEAELGALRNRIGTETAKKQTALESKMEELLEQLPAYRNQLKEKRRLIQTKIDTFEDDLRQGMDQIKAGVKRLFE